MIKQYQIIQSVLITSFLSVALATTGCQKQNEPQPVADDQTSEQATVSQMSATPADTNAVSTELVDDKNVESVDAQTSAELETATEIVNYRCTPALAVAADYDEAKSIANLEIDGKVLILNNTNKGSNPITFEVAQTLKGEEGGLTQWRIAHEDQKTAVLRTSTNENDIIVYECKASG